jgi:hypothetical protein
VTRLEERLRDAYQAAADTVTREMDAPDLTGSVRRAHWLRIGSRPPVIRLAAPLAAAAAVAAIALATSLIATSGPGRRPDHPSGQAHWGLSAVTRVAQGYPGARIPATARPGYYLGIQTSPRGPKEYAFTAYVYSSATGHRTGQLTLPRSGLWVRAVASLGNGAFVVAATKDWPHFGCRSWLYQFRLTAGGQPTGLKPFVVPQVRGWARQLGGSGDGRVAVLTTSRCIRGRTQPMNSHDDRTIAIYLPSAATTTWSPWPRGSNLIPEDVVPQATLSADGRLLAFVAISGHPQDFGLYEQAAYVQLTGHVSGPVARRNRLVLNPTGTNGVIDAALSPNGQVTFVMTARRYAGRWHEMVGAYATKTGKLITVLATASARYLNGDGYLVPDPSGGHLLVVGFGKTNTAVLDIATHRLSILHVQYRNPPLGAGW